MGSARHWPYQPACDHRGGPRAGAPGAALPPARLHAVGGRQAPGREKGRAHHTPGCGWGGHQYHSTCLLTFLRMLSGLTEWGILSSYFLREMASE